MLGAGPDNAERLCLFGLGLYVPVNFFSYVETFSWVEQ